MGGIRRVMQGRVRCQQPPASAPCGVQTHLWPSGKAALREWGATDAGTIWDPASSDSQAYDFGGRDLIPNLAEPQGCHCVVSAAHQQPHKTLSHPKDAKERDPSILATHQAPP